MKVEIKDFFGNEWMVAIGTSLILALLYAIGRKIYNCRNRRKVFLWLKDNTKDKAGEQFKSATEISKGLDIDEEQVSKICTRHIKIFEHSSQKDLWSIYDSEPRSVYEERGIISF
jgi:hypothetical protein